MADDFRDDVSSADYAQALELGLSVDQYNDLLEQGYSLQDVESAATAFNPDPSSVVSYSDIEATLISDTLISGAYYTADKAAEEHEAELAAQAAELEAELAAAEAITPQVVDIDISDIVESGGQIGDDDGITVSTLVAYRQLDPPDQVRYLVDVGGVDEEIAQEHVDNWEDPLAGDPFAGTEFAEPPGADTQYEEAAKAAADAESQYLSAREDREALEAELAGGILVSANYSKDRQYEEIEKMKDKIEVAKFVEETALDTAAATEALKITASEDLMLAEQAVEEQAAAAAEEAAEEAAYAAEDAAEEALYKEQMAMREEVKAELELAEESVSSTDIMKGEAISGAEDIEALQAAALEAYAVDKAAIAAESSEQTKEEAEDLFLEAWEVLGTAKEMVSIVEEDLAAEAKALDIYGNYLLEELGGEEGVGLDAAGNLTTGENLDTREERDAALADVALQLAKVEDLLDPEKGMVSWNDANNDGQIDPGEMAGGLQKDYLDPEAVKLLEEQQKELTELQQQITDAEKLIGFKDDLIAAGGDPNATSNASFWTNAPKYDPKLKFRFRVRIEGMKYQDALGKTADDNPGDDAYNDDFIAGDDHVWYAKSVDKPKISIAKIGENFHTLGSLVSEMAPKPEYPAFGAVSMVLVDPSYPNATRKLIRWFRRAGYNDTQAVASRKSMYNDSAHDAFMKTIGNVQIEQLDVDGTPLETWKLIGAFPQEIDFGQLDYSSNDLVEIKITWAYKTIKVNFPAHGAEEEFPYFNSYNEELDLTPCQQAEAAAKDMGMDYEEWQSGLTDDDTCKGPAITADE